MGRVFAFLIALAGAAALSQGPEYSQQYLQRLSGAVEELRAFVDRFDDDVQAAGIDREEALAAYRESGRFLSLQGVTIENTIERYDYLEEHLAELTAANDYERTWLIVEQHDVPLMRATADDFQPAVPLTLAGAAHAGAGFILGWIIGALIAGLIGLIFSPFMGRKEAY